MAIIGKSFQDYVTKQINLRQKSLGEGFGSTNNPRKVKTLNVYNSSTPFMRLSSAVSITKGDENLPGDSVYKQIKNSGLFDGIGENSWKGTELAKNFVLQGAPNNSRGNGNPSGVNSPGKKNLEVAYGWGYGASQINSEQGYVPPPGVTNIDFEYKNDGALAFATVSIKAFSATQFSMIDILYMRPGYTCLLEFGHSMYYKNTKPNLEPELVSLDTSMTAPFEYLFRNRDITKSPSETITPDDFVGPVENDSRYNQPDPPPTATYTEMAKIIQNEKKKHDGNYEGFFGKISKFNWKFNMDGSYDITVKLTGLGDVISSLKTNLPKITSTPTTFDSNFSLSTTTTSDLPKEKNQPLIISDAQATQLNFELYAIFKDNTLTSNS